MNTRWCRIDILTRCSNETIVSTSHKKGKKKFRLTMGFLITKNHKKNKNHLIMKISHFTDFYLFNMKKCCFFSSRLHLRRSINFSFLFFLPIFLQTNVSNSARVILWFDATSQTDRFLCSTSGYRSSWFASLSLCLSSISVVGCWQSR